MITRIIEQSIQKHCFLGKAIIVYGPRQVGKTTLVKKIMNTYTEKRSRYCTGDDNEIQQIFIPSIRALESIITGYDLIVIDEAQKIKDIGTIIKLLVDTFPEKQIIATGSSSFELANQMQEAMTGRARIYTLFPISVQEVIPHAPLSSTFIEQRLIYGSYPNVIKPNNENAQSYLNNLITHYLYKDILSYEGIQKSHLIIKILQSLALQVGNEFSYNEIAKTVGADRGTVEKYITILEQAFIIKLLRPLHKNQRTEIKENKKAYFRDLGVRNALIDMFSPLSLRNDVGALRENFFYIERLKYLTYQEYHKQLSFRRAQTGEIDLIEQENGHYTCFECKYSSKKSGKLPKLFASTYPDNSYTTITPENIGEYIR